MPPLQLTPEQEAEALKKGNADLKFLLERNEVPASIAAKWFHAGVTSMERFSNIANDVADLLTVLKDHLGLDQAASLEQRVQVASVTCAWSNARARIQRAAEVEAELDTKEWRKPIATSEWLAMKSGLEKSVGTLDERYTPAKEYVEKKLQEVESGDYRAEEMCEVVSREEVDPDSLVPQWDSKGNITVRKGSTKVKDPENPEALRQRLTVMRNAYQMVALRHTNRPELQGDYVKVFEDFKDYLLGEHVFGLNAKDAEGLTVAAPPFRLVLSYEKAIRKEAARKMNQEGMPYPTALRAAWRDSTVKERHFTTPLALVAKRPSAPQAALSAGPAAPKKPRFDGKGGGKAPAKGRQLAGCHSHNKEGTPICYRFNTVGEKCKQKKCKFAHQCGICFSDKHAMYQCTAASRQPPDTGGAS